MISTRFALVASALLLVAACNGGGGSPTVRPSTAVTASPTTAPTAAPTTAPTAAPTTAPTATPTTAPSQTPSARATVCDNLPAGSEGDLLATICARAVIKMSTDPAYPPQSVLAPNDPLGYEGFDIDVGHEIANRLGVDIAFETPAWEVLTAGSWNGRWDFSVGSMTITAQREGALHFTQPYYYTPAQMAVPADSDITDVAGLAGKVVCVGADTTYLAWIEGTLDFGSATTGVTAAEPPQGMTATTLPTDINCAENWQSGRHDFDGWLTSITTAQGAVDNGLPVKLVGDPVFFEPLAVAFDKNGTKDPTTLVTAVNDIVGEMHADGTLSDLSNQWFGEDYTVSAAE